MDWAYDKLTDRIIIHVDGTDSWEQRQAKYQKILTSEHWHPFKTKVLMLFTADALTAIEPFKHQETMSWLKEYGVTVLYYKVNSKEVAAGLLVAKDLGKLHNMDIRVFTKLQDMFDALNEDVE
jgi:hypothetical protein